MFRTSWSHWWKLSKIRMRISLVTAMKNAAAFAAGAAWVQKQVVGPVSKNSPPAELCTRHMTRSHPWDLA